MSAMRTSEKATLGRIVRELPKLSKESRSELKKRIDALIALEAGSEPPSSFPDRDWLTEGFWYQLARKGLVPQAFSPIRVKNSAPKGYTERCAAMREHLLSRIDRELTYQGQVVLGRLCAESLFDWLFYFRESVRNVTLGVLMRNVENVPFALDRDYPGYLECGHLGMLIRERRTQK